MSGSQHRPPGPARPARRSGPDRPVTHGFSRIPGPARPVVVCVLDEMGLGALVDLCGGLRLELFEICRMERDGAGRWVLNGESVPLPEETSSRLEALKCVLAERAKARKRPAAELAADLLKAATTEVRRRLSAAGHAWAPHVVVSTRTLHQMADEAAVRLFGDDPARLRNYRRSPYAKPGEVRPPTTEEVADAFDEAMAPLVTDVLERLSERARSALKALGATL